MLDGTHTDDVSGLVESFAGDTQFSSPPGALYITRNEIKLLFQCVKALGIPREKGGVK